MNPSGNQRDQKAERLGPVTCSATAGKKGRLLPATKRLLLSQGTRKPQNLLWGIQVDSDHNQKLPLPFAYANRAAQLQSSRALYSCQVGAVNAAETRVGQPAWQKHLVQGKNITAASLPAGTAPSGVCQAPGLAGWHPKISKGKKKADVSFISIWFSSTFCVTMGLCSARLKVGTWSQGKNSQQHLMGDVARDLPAQKPAGGCWQQRYPGAVLRGTVTPGPGAACHVPRGLSFAEGPAHHTCPALRRLHPVRSMGQGSTQVSSAERQSTGQRQGESSRSLGMGARWPCTGSQSTPPLTLLRVPLLGGLSLLRLRARHWWAEKQSAGGAVVLAPQSTGWHSDTPNITQRQTSAQDFHSARAARFLPLPLPPPLQPRALPAASQTPQRVLCPPLLCSGSKTTSLRRAGSAASRHVWLRSLW